MNRSKLPLKAIMLISGIGLAAAALGGSQSVAAQSYSDDYSCPAGYAYDPDYGCTLPGYAYEPYDYGYLPYYGGYGSYYSGPHRDFGHGFAHGMGGGFTHDFKISAAASGMAQASLTPAVAASDMGRRTRQSSPLSDRRHSRAGAQRRNPEPMNTGLRNKGLSCVPELRPEGPTPG